MYFESIFNYKTIHIYVTLIESNQIELRLIEIDSFLHNYDWFLITKIN